MDSEGVTGYTPPPAGSLASQSEPSYDGEGVDAAEAAVGITPPCDGVPVSVTVVTGRCGDGEDSGRFSLPRSVFWGAREGFDHMYFLTKFATLSRAVVELEVEVIRY